MSGIDDYTRFYWSVDNASVGMNDAWLSQAYFDTNTSTWYSLNPNTGAYDLPGNRDDYPHLSIGQSYEGYVYPSGKFGLGFQVSSYNPDVIPTRPRVYWSGSDKTNYNAVKGLYACLDQDYTIDFWFKLNAGASGKQPIFFCEKLGWEIYYQNGFIVQKQGLNNLISCAVDFSDLGFHHIEFNRSSGTNRIFVDGLLKTLNSNSWFITTDILIISLTDSGTFWIGCPTNTYRNVDYIIDEVRFSTGIAGHTENFTVATSAYTREPFVIEIDSPTNAQVFLAGNLEFSVVPDLSQTRIPSEKTFAYLLQNESNSSGNVVLEVSSTEGFEVGKYYQIVGLDGKMEFILILEIGIGTITVSSLTNNYLAGSKIGLYGFLHLVFNEPINMGLEVYRYPFSFPLTMTLNYVELFTLEANCIGLTVPPIIDGEIIFDLSFTEELIVGLGNIIDVLEQGTIYRLINNALKIPTEFSAIVQLNRGTAKVPEYSITFWNKLLNDFEGSFSFKNVLNSDYVSQFVFKNVLTSPVEKSFSFPNKVLLKNEFDKDFTFANRLLDESVFESYTTFYFSERHGL